MNDSAGSTWWSWHFEKIMLLDFEWKFGYEACSSQICATSAEWRAKTKCFEVSQEHTECANNDENLCKKLSLLAKRKRFMDTMSKQKTTLNNGFQNPQSELKNHGKFSQRWRWWWLCMCVFSFVSVGFVHHEFSPPSHTVNKQYYLEVIKCLQEALKGKRPNFRRQKKIEALT
jgi:hypothetical protein